MVYYADRAVNGKWGILSWDCHETSVVFGHVLSQKEAECVVLALSWLPDFSKLRNPETIKMQEIGTLPIDVLEMAIMAVRN